MSTATASLPHPTATNPNPSESHDRRLLSENNPKTAKGQALGFLTGILHLAPATLAGFNVCPDSTAGCRAACLNTAGRGGMSSIQVARVKRSQRFKRDRAGFVADLAWSIDALVRRAKRLGLTPLVRLNGTSDLPWENIDGLMARYPGVRFYDYTKSARRMWRSLTDPTWPANYTLTFSRSECNDRDALTMLRAGGNVAVVFSTPKGQPLPATWHGFKVTDGDVSDARPSDLRGVVIGLRPKGRAKRDASGFVVTVGA